MITKRTAINYVAKATCTDNVGLCKLLTLHETYSVTYMTDNHVRVEGIPVLLTKSRFMITTCNALLLDKKDFK
jgi:hypothetical protein